MKDDETRKKKDQKVPLVVEEQARALMQAIPDLVFLLGLDGRYIEIFSAPAEDLFVPREQLLGRKVTEVLPPPVGQDCMDAILQLKSPRDVSSFSYELPIEGKTRWFEGRVALCGENTVIVLVRDFTEQRLAELQLRDANSTLQRRAQRLQRLEQELTRVEQRERRRMAHLLHDNLQQLLVGAKFGVSILADHAQNSEDLACAREVTETLNEAIHQSRMLTADLCPPILYEGSLKQSLEWIKNHVARLHSLDVTLFIDEKSNSHSLADPIRFTIFNSIQELLLNIVKHSGVSEATLRVENSPPNTLIIVVSDKGCGPPPDLFEQEDNGLEGFGLFTLQERVASLGGTVDITTPPQGGCTVTLSIPVVVTDPLENQVKSTGKPDPSDLPQAASYNARGKGPIRVLLADDHAVLREGLIRILLQETSFSIVGEAEDGETAVQLADQLTPHVVLMDVMMPGIGGAEATRRIRRAHPEIQVIALSMYEERERGAEMREAGAADYITKSQAAVSVADAIRSCCKTDGDPS